MWIIKRSYPSGYCLQNPLSGEKPNVVLWTKQEAKESARFIEKTSVDQLQNYLLSRGIPFQIHK